MFCPKISDENVHHVRELMDEVFGAANFCSLITFQKTGSIAATLLGTTVDYIVWYAKDRPKAKYRQLYLEREQGDTSLDRYDQIELPDGTARRLERDEISGKKEGVVDAGYKLVHFGGRSDRRPRV